LAIHAATACTLAIGWPAPAPRETTTAIVVEMVAAAADTRDEPPPETVVPAPRTLATETKGRTEPTKAAANGSESGAEARSCNIVGDLTVALQIDEAAIAGLSALPAGSVSVANAVLLWDGAWLKASDAGHDPLRYAIQRRLRESAAPCLAETIEGPRFLVLSRSAHATVIVFGSGAWRWADLLGASVP
jgi:hypothetical protein